MSTAEQAAPQTDVPEIEPLPVAVTFASRGRFLTVERVHPRRIVDGAGASHWTQPVAYEFNEGQLVVYPGNDLLADKFDPTTGSMEEQDVLEYLRGHELFGTDRGFWEVPPVAPDPAPVLALINKLSFKAGNPETRAEAERQLVDIHEIEADSWKRQPLLDACRATLALIESSADLTAPARAEGEPWLGSGASRETLVPPPHPSQEHIGPDHVSQVPRGSGPKPQNLEAGFNPDAAPPAQGN